MSYATPTSWMRMISSQRRGGAATPARTIVRQRLGWGLAWLMCVASGTAVAAGPTGPIGPTGATGPTGPVAPTRAESPATSRPQPTSPSPLPAPVATPAPPVQSRSGDAPAGNRIEVTGNTATGVRCSGDGAASVNSVDVSGARMDGRTVIVQGRNTSDVNSTRDCPPRNSASTPTPAAPGQTNSIRIR